MSQPANQTRELMAANLVDRDIGHESETAGYSIMYSKIAALEFMRQKSQEARRDGFRPRMYESGLSMGRGHFKGVRLKGETLLQ